MPARAQYEAPDPSRNVPHGRVLALGRAYMGLSEGTAAIYCNPAGLSRSSQWEISSMSGTFMGSFNYLSFSGLYPTNYGVFGVGYMGASISGAFATIQDPDSSEEDPVYIIDTSQTQISYSNNVAILSYGEKLSRFFKRFGWEDRISLGANLKFFSSGLTGDGIAEGEGVGNGTEIDLGVMYDTNWPWLSLGLTLQNVLPASMGGKLHYASGHDESYPMVFEVGAAVNLLGKENALRRVGNHELKFLLDYYTKPTVTQYPATLHMGLEYRPMPMVALRTGIDQDASGDGTGTSLGTDSNLTGGVGIDIGGFKFDYAYHQFAGVSQMSNNYFSLSYSPMGVMEYAGPAIVVEKPEDKEITFAERSQVSGKVISKNVASVTVNGLAPKMTFEGDFHSLQALKIGKNAIVVAGLDRDKKEIFSKKFRILRLKPFPDVVADHWVRMPISLLAMQTIITGYPDGTFKPEGEITRAEMCTLLMKTKLLGDKLAGTPEATPEAEEKFAFGFEDVAPSHWAAKYVDMAAELGVVKGYPDGTFKPKNNITRAEGVAMIARFAGIYDEEYAAQFPDLASSHWVAKTVSGAYGAGILDYLKGKRFEPKRLLTRAETVEMLYRTSYVRDDVLAKDLLNWETY